jgi:8-oxo-dGTP pyrophosphatase MutT (NUDIX family)
MTPNSPLHHRTIQSDQSLYDTALRETSEELGIDPEQVEFVGRLGPGEISLGGLLVHVFIVSRGKEGLR